MPRALPPVECAGLDNLPDVLSAYNICLELEAKATTDENLIHARILGYLILHAGSNPLTEVVKAIHSCACDERKLYELGACFRSWFVRPSRTIKGWTPANTVTDRPSSPSFDEVGEGPNTTRNHSEAKARALVRDGYRCVVTGIYDVIAKKKSYADVQTILAAGGAVHTELSHIMLPGPSEECASSVLGVLQRFGYDTVNGPKVHSLYNVMTMQKDVHDWFDRLYIWFESTEVANHYRVKTIDRVFRVQLPAEVTFTSPDPVDLPCPSRWLLDLHAARAKVAHLSGAGEWDRKFRLSTKRS